MTNFVGMGCYYNTKSEGLLRTVCRATVASTGEEMIGYVKVQKDGCVSNVLLMPEEQFKSLLVK